MIHKIKKGNELYIYMNGELLYKRWIDKNYGMIIQSNAWGSFKACDTELFKKLKDENTNNRTSSGSS